MTEVLFFWLSIEAMGLAAFPVAFVFFGKLPDRGYAFSKPLGLLMVSFALWVGATLGVLQNDRGSVLLLLLALGAVSLGLAGRNWPDLRRFLANGAGYILVAETLFLAVFAVGAYIRSYAPDIVWGEKPFELAFLNSVVRAEHFPPPDPWLAGEDISYYYFGYLQTSVLTKLSGLATSSSFILMVCLIAAMSASAVFGLVYNLVSHSEAGRLRRAGLALREGAELSWARPLLFALAGAGLLLLVSNLEGVFELLARHGIGSQSFYAWVGINDLNGQYDCSAAPGDCREWYPTRWWWWWKATRIGSGFDIQEFPFFSFQFGDLHPHVMAIPFIMLAAGAAFNLLGWREERYDWQWWLRRPWMYLFLGLILGGAFFVDLWTLPILFALLAVTAFLHNWPRAEWDKLWRALAQAGGFALSVLFLAVLLYLPLYVSIGGAVSGIQANQAWMAEASGLPPLNTAVTRPVHYLIFWLPVIWLPLSLLVFHNLRRAGARTASVLLAAIAPWLAAVLAWAALILVTEGLGAAGGQPHGLLGEVDARWDNFNWLTLLMIVTFLSLAVLALLQELRRQSGERDIAALFVFAIVSLAFLLMLGAELFFVADRLGMRLNTVFRFWYQAWLLLVVAGAFSAYYVTREWRPQLKLGSVSRAAPGFAWAGLTACVIAAGLVYTVLVTFERTNGFDNPYRGLNGLEFVRRYDAAEYEAIRWLNTRVAGSQTVLEAQGNAYTDYGRISSRTGLPTVLGWITHEYQWRGSYELVDGRPEDIVRIYTTYDSLEAERLMRKYDVRYVYVGKLEREQYVDNVPSAMRQSREQALAKFGQFMDIVYQQDGVSIYRTREAVPLTQESTPAHESSGEL